MNRIFLPIFLLLCSCKQSGQEFLCTLYNIKHFGDENPEMALEKLDSLSSSINYEPLHSRMKYKLLRIRLQDKAYIQPNSDIQIREILPYFSEKGSFQEKQEMLYYAGSVYRDLNDTPRALDYFLKSKDAAESAGMYCDSIMLRNTYSNLCFLFGWEHDKKSALEYARKEYEMSLSLGKNTVNSLLHMGETLFACDSISSALSYFDQIILDPSEKNPSERSIIVKLLYIYSHLQKKGKAEKYFDILTSMVDYSQMSPKELFSLGEYYRINKKYDESINCNKRIIEESEDLMLKYDAARYLFLLYKNVGNKNKAIYYGDQFIDICGDLNLGGRQELAATVNNIYNYYKDKEIEQNLLIENQEYHERNKRIVFICIILSVIGIAAVVYYRYWQIRKMLTLKGKIENINKEKERIVQESISKQAELLETKDELNKTMEGLAKTRETLNKTTEEVNRLTEELRAKECVLKEKIEQNKTIISLMHQTEFEESAEEIIHTLKKSGDGLKQLSEKEWNMLYYAVDKLCPMFKEQMCSKLGRVTDQQRQVCYLLRAGFTPPQIQNMIGLSRTTMWRYTKKYDWINSIL